MTAPNPRLNPETANNFTGQLAYYFEPVGQFAITAAQRNVKNLLITNTVSAAEFVYTVMTNSSATTSSRPPFKVTY